MRFSFTSALALLSAPLLALADSPNPFNVPADGLSATGGQALKLEWNPTTDGTVSLILRSGNSADLTEGTVIASKIDNGGTYTWTPSNSLTRGIDYTIEIVSDDDPTQTNYTPYFTLDTTTTTPQSTSKVNLGMVTSTSGSSSSEATLPIHNTFTHSTGTTKVDTITGTSPTGGATAASSTSAPDSANSGARATAVAAGIFGIALGALAL